MSSKPVCNVGANLVVTWDTEDGSKETFQVKVVKIKECKDVKHNSKFMYTLEFDEASVDAGSAGGGCSGGGSKSSSSGIGNKRTAHQNDEVGEVDDEACGKVVRKSRLLNLEWNLSDKVSLSSNTSLLKSGGGSSSISTSSSSGRAPSKGFKKITFPYRMILAPMVGGSELAYRLLCRKYGTQLAYTPMINSEKFAVEADYREEQFQCTAEDRPLVAHFSANEPNALLAAAKHIEDRCDAIDLNLGCPQRVAFTGHFGSYLLDEVDRPLICSIVKKVSENIKIPLFVKIRLLDTVPDTIKLVTELIEAGASLVAIHGRYRVNLVGRTGPGARDGPAHLDQIQTVREAIRAIYPDVPIIANGNIITWDDVKDNLVFTKADGVMSAEGILDNPALFHKTKIDDIENYVDPANKKLNIKDLSHFKSSSSSSKAGGGGGGGGGGALKTPKNVDLAIEYLDLVDKYPVKLKSVIFHVRRICRDVLTKYQVLEDCVNAQTLEEVRRIVLKTKQLETDEENGQLQFAADIEKEKANRQALKKRQFNESSRKRYEERLARKAKREGKPSDHYLNIGIELPSIDELSELKRLPEEKSFQVWKDKHSQHCYAFHFQKGGCPRERACAFLHNDASYTSVEAFG